MRCRVFSYQLCIMNCVNRVKHVWWIAAKPSVGNIRVISIAAVRSGMWAVNSYHAELFHRIPNIYSHFESHRGFGLTQIHGINSGTTTYVTCIVVCLSTPWGINNKSEVDIHLAVINDKRSSKSATSLSHSHSLTNWYTGYMHDDQ